MIFSNNYIAESLGFECNVDIETIECATGLSNFCHQVYKILLTRIPVGHTRGRENY